MNQLAETEGGGRARREGVPIMVRAAATAPRTLNEAARTVEVTFSTGAAVERYDWNTGQRFREVLSHASGAVRLGRMNAGAPVLDTHNGSNTACVLGVVEDARVDGKAGVAVLRFSHRPDAERVFADVRAGVLRNVSVGYVVHRWAVERASDSELELRTAVDWEPYEVSIVPVPADAGAQVRAFGGKNMSMIMNEQTEQQSENITSEGAVLVADRRRSAAILELARAHGVESGRAQAWISEGASLDAVRSAILDSIVARSAPISVVTSGDGARSASMVRDASDALALRSGARVEGDGHRHFGDANLLEIGRRALESGGVNTRGLSRHELATRALTTSDFASIMSAAGKKIARSAYDAIPLVHREIFRKSFAKDFKAKHSIIASAAGTLPEVPEGGVIPRKSLAAERASYSVKTYASIIPITRQLVVNDDFDLVASAARQRGRAAAETERKLVWEHVMSNPVAADGLQTFHASHGNFPAPSATPISAAALTGARAALRAAKAPDGLAINATLAHVVVGIAGETEWDQLVNGVYMPQASGASMTERLRRVQIHVEPMLSETKRDWYGFADYNMVDTFEYAYLDGSDGLRIEQRVNFETEALELKVALDFGVGVIDHRGCYLQRES